MLPVLFKNISKDCLLITRDCNLIYSPFCFQSVRWARKPWWLPTAKSKMFRIPERPKIPKEELQELQRLHKIYKTEMKSLRLFFAEEIRSQQTGEEVIAEQLKLEEEEHQRALKINDEWNKSVASLRLSRIAEEKELELQKIIKEVEESKRLGEERRAQLELLVKEEKEKSKSYITPQNIDEAIEKALSSSIDHDYSIDLEGNKFIGRHTKPQLIQQPTPQVSKEVAI